MSWIDLLIYTIVILSVIFVLVTRKKGGSGCDGCSGCAAAHSKEPDFVKRYRRDQAKYDCNTSRKTGN